jgi:transposase-like protein
MPCSVRPRAKTCATSKRPAHRPTKFSAELGEKICELVACGWLMKDAALHFGLSPETVSRWVVKHEDFRQAYAVARAQRIEVWAEEIIEIADDATRDYTIDKDGNRIFNHESVHRARLRIEGRKWIMARLDPLGCGATARRSASRTTGPSSRSRSAREKGAKADRRRGEAAGSGRGEGSRPPPTPLMKILLLPGVPFATVQQHLFRTFSVF